MSEDSLSTLSMVGLVGAFVALTAVIYAQSMLGRKYSEFIDKHITSMREAFRKQAREANKAMSEVITRLERGGDSTRDVNERVIAMEMELNRLELILERLESKAPKSKQVERKSA